MYLTLPISARDTRYQSAVRIQEQPQIYLPRFSWIWDRRREATAGSPVVYGEEIKVDWSRRSAACYLVSFAISMYILATDNQFCGERFCFVLNRARPLLPLESMFFETARAGKGFFHAIFQVFTRLIFPSTCDRNLYQIRWSDDSDLWHWERWWCQSSKRRGRSGKKVQKTVVRVCLSTMCRCLLRRQVVVNIVLEYRPYSSTFNLMADLHNQMGNHQDQVKVLIEKTASSLDDTALKILFVSVQQNNIDLCVQSAIDLYVMFSLFEIWQWLFSAWLTRLTSIVLSVLIIGIQMTV